MVSWEPLGLLSIIVFFMPDGVQKAVHARPACSFREHRLDVQSREHTKRTLLIYVREPVEDRIKKVVPQGQPLPEDQPNQAGGESEVKVPTITGVIKKRVVSEKVPVGRIGKRQLPGEMRDCDSRHGARL